jgi:hypothetical protein
MQWLTKTPFLMKERGFFIANQAVAADFMPSGDVI